ncbi:hypothetical protein [Chryseobacterium aquaticum]|jgi:ABC-type Fe3+ transport system permease subunit|uniref:Uncharacterized protein n=1 Tax=Chryseobacterium aquaticum subsp. greenlandense TaxID=345663 RepID=A0A124F3D9_9FLAO|nr:hypothetical protein [Chryseobacterium aquaticum]KUJ57644.1 hypothetical protein AR686_02455 [Chryseobacterium aquaticum subsp. greenlandense]
MKTLTILEVGGLEGFVAMIILMILAVAFVISLVVTAIVKLIYESKDGRKFSKSQFWQTMLISLLICGLISGFVCGGM